MHSDKINNKKSPIADYNCIPPLALPELSVGIPPPNKKSPGEGGGAKKNSSYPSLLKKRKKKSVEGVRSTPNAENNLERRRRLYTTLARRAIIF